jgi:hypothetical protein
MDWRGWYFSHILLERAAAVPIPNNPFVEFPASFNPFKEIILVRQ